MFSLSEITPRLRSRRRAIFLGLNLLLLGLGVAAMTEFLAQQGMTALEVILLLIFGLLLAQIVFGFTTATIGFWLLLRGGDRVRINNTLPARPDPKELPATAIVMPIFNEDVSRVFQGIRVMYESLQRTGQGEAFDFFILSDSNDANYWIAEEKAWLELCKQLQGFGRIFYRKRRITLHHKSGNIADFCRRWGAKYRYMIVLDADSVMTGEAFVRLAQLMEQHPRVGIIQTNPQLVLGKSLFQRIMQFVIRLSGPAFAAGTNFWQLDSGNFWGHNAILRLRPFMKHCAMPELPRIGPLGSRILSHDTIEAALMRRAGYGVWFAYDLEGSFEEGPPHLLASLQRDRRWCHGNLQHLWFLGAHGLKPVSRWHILNGIMAYLSSPLWLLFLLLSTIAVVNGAPPPALATQAVEVNATQGLLLFACVMSLLLLPKIFGLILFFRRREQLKALGGGCRIIVSAIGESLFSVLLAPVLMLFVTRFVWACFTGRKATWGGQKRVDDAGPSWRELIVVHWANTLFVLAWVAVIAWMQPAFLPWMAPIFIGPIFAIPFSRLTASIRPGARARKNGLFLIPEETRPPLELQQIQEPFTVPTSPFFQTREYAANYGLLQAILDPYVNAVHVSLLRQRYQVSIRTRAKMNTLSERLLLDGPASLTGSEKGALLWDADSMMALHQKLWASPASHLHEWWQAAFRHYNESIALSIRRTVSSV